MKCGYIKLGLWGPDYGLIDLYSMFSNNYKILNYIIYRYFIPVNPCCGNLSSLAVQSVLTTVLPWQSSFDLELPIHIKRRKYYRVSTNILQ